LRPRRRSGLSALLRSMAPFAVMFQKIIGLYSLSVAVWPAHLAFHPPEYLATPIILLCAGTGIAPFLGFLQERAIKNASGQALLLQYR